MCDMATNVVMSKKYSFHDGSFYEYHAVRCSPRLQILSNLPLLILYPRWRIDPRFSLYKRR